MVRRTNRPLGLLGLSTYLLYGIKLPAATCAKATARLVKAKPEGKLKGVQGIKSGDRERTQSNCQ